MSFTPVNVTSKDIYLRYPRLPKIPDSSDKEVVDWYKEYLRWYEDFTRLLQKDREDIVNSIPKNLTTDLSTVEANIATNTTDITQLQNEVSAIDTELANIHLDEYYTKVQTDGMFDGKRGEKYLVNYDNLVNVPPVVATSRHAFLITASSTSVTTASVNYIDIPFDTKTYDPENLTSGSTFTAPVTGLYQFNCCYSIKLTGTSGGFSSTYVVTRLLKSGVLSAQAVTYGEGTTAPTYWTGVEHSPSAALYMTAGQTARFQFGAVFTGTGTWTVGTVFSSPIASFSGFLAS